MNATGGGEAQSGLAGPSFEDLRQLMRALRTVIVSARPTIWEEWVKEDWYHPSNSRSGKVKYAYIIEVMREGGDVWFTLAQCESADIAAEVVRILLKAWGKTRSLIRLSVTDAIAPAII